MNILAIDTSSQNATVALINDERLIGEYTISNKKTHSQIIMPLISDMIKKSGIDINDIDFFAAGIGPGSFTGLRIGIATAKALAQANSKKIIGISSLHALASSVEHSEKLICPIIDARRNDVYNAIYNDGICIKEERVINIEELICELNGKKTIFLGDGADIFKDLIKEKMGDAAYFVSEDIRLVKASNIAKLAMKRAKAGDFDDIYTLSPVYLRSSQAEREYNERVKQI